MNWKEVIHHTEQQLQQYSIADANSNAEYLAMHILGIWNKSELRHYLDESLSNEQAEQYEQLILRRINHEPLQHIIGETEFFGLRLFTSHAALIPRPETEILVEEALKEAGLFAKKNLIFD